MIIIMQDNNYMIIDSIVIVNYKCGNKLISVPSYKELISGFFKQQIEAVTF